MLPRPLPPVEFLRECFDYNPETGVFFWRRRPDGHFVDSVTCALWNAAHAGRRAFASRTGNYQTAIVTYAGQRVRLSAGRVAMKLALGRDPIDVDHMNFDTSDNRLANLREASRSDNNAHRRGNVGKVLPKGVFARRAGGFLATVGYARSTVKLGVFSTPAEAHEAYCAAARRLHGEFFNPGPPKPSVFD